jgi:DNA-binding GntR family transcriptional regulator
VSGGAGPGRPRIQETADRAVAQLLAVAGDRVDGPAFSTRALAERTGFSQTVVSRAVRRIADGADGAAVGVETAVEAVTGDEAVEGDEAVTAVEAVTGPIPAEGAIPAVPVEEPVLLTGLDVDDGVCRAEFVPAPPQVRVRWTRRHLRRRAALLSALRIRVAALPRDLPGRLARTVEIPGDLLEVLARAEADAPVSWRVGQVETGGARGSGELHGSGEPVGSAVPTGVAGNADGAVAGLVQESAAEGPPPGIIASDGRTAEADRSTAWLPRAGVSVTEQLAVRLRDAIMVSDLRPGDRLSVAHCARLLEVPRSVASDVLRRMVDDELLDGTGGEVRIPQASPDDVIELYAARMLLGDVLLRAAATRPRARLLRARQVLGVIEDAVAAGTNVGDADLRFQQEVARASGLEQTVRLFESSTVRVQMLIALLGMDYARAGRSILADDRRILAALVAGDAGRAVEAWHRKTDAAVRHMHGRARHTAFDVELWRRLTAL